MPITQQIEPQIIYKSPPRALNLEISQGQITACLDDGRKLSIPTTWFPRLRKANLKQLKNYRILPDGYHLHWPELDEDLSLRIFTDGLESGCC
ncbi:MAG: hypothetical protein MRECE_1c107 [Mycoplasmataceae bacterium CE_OT135]|nr:MAG: hypothetical protein MRECE_1c060 [Mycoplasmataceae bacterium CE_OT135]KLL04343.1 MAG: hypothetical protein MRECE_1c107 [Mycoplasmataceae bacterium CE_OT135]